MCASHGAAGEASKASENVLVNGRGALRVKHGGFYPAACGTAAGPGGVMWRLIIGRTGVLANGHEIVTVDLPTAHPHSPGRFAAGSSNVLVGGPTVNVFERARAAAFEKLDDAEAALLRWNDADRKNFRRWFGDDSESARQEMLAKIRKTREQLKAAELVVGDKRDALGHVHPNDGQWFGTPTIELDHMFFDESGTTGRSGERAVLIHEASHFSAGAGEDDEKLPVVVPDEHHPEENIVVEAKAYDLELAERLAIKDPAAARNNADSVAIFAETSRPR